MGRLARRHSDLLPNVAAQIGWIYQAVMGNATTKPMNDHVTACQQHRITSNIDRFSSTAVILLDNNQHAVLLLYCLQWESHDDRKASPTSKREACCIADSCASLPDAFLRARTGGIVRSQGQFEVLHVRLIRGQRLLIRGTAEEVHTTTMIDIRGTSTSLQSLTADLPV